ncbi:extracellular solute-binding protein [uncultured Cohaesibacter sp.]|uniref:ABC transporter substrate-binding protein n=1 Tax=uncultured Cohaesibacter sp. TaxID=1002546 RepID=UPI0029C8D271|nr:extracellular solute-binding protein [uncultured Cohaesibacter sp.]
MNGSKPSVGFQNYLRTAAKMSLRLNSALLATVFATGFIASAEAQDAPAKPEKLVMNVWGGPFEACISTYSAKPFEKDTGIKVELLTKAPPLAKLQAEGDSPEVDILIGGSVQRGIAEAQGLIVDLDESNIPELKDVYDMAKYRNGVVVNFSSLGLAYDTTKWDKPPTSWFDLVSAETPGKIVVRQPDAQNTVAWMAIMAKELNGDWPTTIDEYEKVGELLNENMKPRLAVIATNTATTRAAFTDAGVSLGVWTDTQVSNFAKASGLPIAFVAPKEGATMIDSTAMVTRTPNKYWAEKLIGYILSHDAQKGCAESGFYAPSNSTVELGDEMVGKVTFGKEAISNLVSVPWDKLNPINQDIAELFYGSVQ